MDALVPAFIAALLAGIGDRPSRLAAMLGDRGALYQVVAGLILGHAVGIGISVVGAIVIAPLLTPNARALMLAIALLFAGIGALWGGRRPAPPTGNAFVAAATGSFVMGDRTAFLAFGLAIKGSAPLLAGIGALAGATLLATVAAMVGAHAWERLPLALLSRIAGALLLVTGLVVAGGALRVI
ncbi:MAG: hypothetical protein V4537_01450 [Pseudomonadota bacterium]